MPPPSPPIPGPCLDEHQVLELIDGRLDDRRRATVELHLDACPRCRTLVAEVIKTSPQVSRTLPGSPDPSAVPPPEVFPRPAAGATLGRFVILKPVGEGGMGAVYAAFDPLLDRKVALKVLRAGGSAEPWDPSSRLLREGRAMARLSHPNVVGVFDVGTWEGHGFVAMEFIDGQTLESWLSARPRGWREILATFALAGRGLAAAHDAGFIHRDFKPDNVLVSTEGRVAVTDFGLAGGGPLGAVIGSLGVSPDSKGAAPRLTETGALVGTPAYMSPEQLRGEPAGAGADQFSFCVALYEALYGARPFRGRTLLDLQQAVERGVLSAPVDRREVPSWVRRVVLRGLSASPAQRYPSMKALLADLERDPARARRRWAVGGAALVAVLAAVATGRALLQRQALTCKGAEREWQGIWDPAQREAIRASFLATGKPWAPDVFEGVALALDSYAAGWARVHTDACEATRLRREQSEGMLELRMICLDQRLREVRALTTLFLHADAELLDKAPRAASALTTLEGCSDLQTLAAQTQAPADGPTRAGVDRLRGELAREKALFETGRFSEGLALAQATATAARALGFKPIEAEALMLRGELEDAAGKVKDAAGTLQEAALAAQASRSDEVAARAWTDLVLVVGEHLDQHAQGLIWGQYAAATLERLGGNELLRARLLNNLGNVASRQGNYLEAKAQHEKALQIRTRLLSPDNLEVVESLSNLASSLDDLAEYEAALASYARVQAIRERLLGKDSPAVADVLHNIGIVYAEEGHYLPSLAANQRALAIREAALGPQHPKVASSLNELGIDLQHLGRFAEAIAAYERAAAIYEKALGPESPRVASALTNLGAAYQLQGKYSEANDRSERALAIFEKALGPEHPKLCDPLGNLGQTAQLQGRYANALARHQRALAILEKALGPNHPDLGLELTGIGQAQLSLGVAGKAVAPLERALKIRESHPGSVANRAETEFVLAQALWQTGGDRARAVKLAAAARDHYAQSDRPDGTAEVAAWLARHPAPAL